MFPASHLSVLSCYVKAEAAYIGWIRTVYFVQAQGMNDEEYQKMTTKSLDAFHSLWFCGKPTMVTDKVGK